MTKTLLVVDMQNDFITGSLGSQDAISIIDNVKTKIDKYHSQKQQVIFTRDSHDQNYLQSQEGQNLPIIHCQINTPGWEINNQLIIKNNDIIINKASFGHNWNQEINKQPNLFSGNKIEIIGLCTDICVISNALILKSIFPEKEIIVDASCCAGITKETHNYALEVMKMCQIKIINQD